MIKQHNNILKKHVPFKILLTANEPKVILPIKQFYNNVNYSR